MDAERCQKNESRGSGVGSPAGRHRERAPLMGEQRRKNITRAFRSLFQRRNLGVWVHCGPISRFVEIQTLDFAERAQRSGHSRPEKRLGDVTSRRWGPWKT